MYCYVLLQGVVTLVLSANKPYHHHDNVSGTNIPLREISDA